MKRVWKCTVCGYVREGETPPDVCPLCGAEASAFILLEAEKLNIFRDLVANFALHPVAAHFPNGLLPSAFLLLLLAFFVQIPCLEEASFFILLLALAALPVSFVSGIRDWKRRMRGIKAKIFYKKIALALLLFLLGLSSLLLRFFRHDLLLEGGTTSWIYTGLFVAMLACAVLLGHYGGKLAYQWKKKKS